MLELKEPLDSIGFLPQYHMPPYITLAHIYHAPEGWEMGERALKQHQFQLVAEGGALYRIGDHEYVTKRGDLLYHGPGENHSITTSPGIPYNCLSIVFHFGQLEVPMQTILGELHDMGNHSGKMVESLLSQIVSAYQQPWTFSPMYCQGLLLRVIHELSISRRVRRLNADVLPKNQARMLLVKRYIEQHYGDPFSHEQLEEVAGLSRNYIMLNFKKMFGVAPFDYLCLVRIERAKELALQSRLNVSEIAERVGYSNVHAFGKMFKKKNGMSMREFMASIWI